MKPIRSSLLLLCAVAILLPISGCGGASAADPQRVFDTALSRESLLSEPTGKAEVEVASLGYEDAVLKSRRLAIDRKTNRAIRGALAGSTGDAAGSDEGLAGLIGDLKSEESTEIDGAAVNRISGSIDVDGLISRARPLAEDSRTNRTGEIPGVGELDQLEKTLVAAGFELFARQDDGSLERFDLILSLDNQDNALPPSRIRFSLTDPVSDGGGP